MRAFASILRREIAERRLLLLAAVLLGMVPLAVPLLPLAHVSAADARSGTALALSLISSFVLALALGGTVLARDLAERRMGFYFSRPLPGWAIWGGKLAAAVLLAFGSGLLILLPSVLLGDRPDPSGFLWQGADLGLWAGSILAVLLLANAVSVAVRSRSPWLLLDLLAAAVLAGLVWLIAQRLVAASAFEALARAQLGLLAGIVFSLAAASALQVIRARTDLRRGHRILSLTLWSLTGLSVLAFGGFTRWVLSAEPKDLGQIVEVISSPSGDWIGVSGRARLRAGYVPAFLLDTRSGRFVRINPYPGVWNGLTFSRDGRHAVWVESRGGSQFFALHLDLARPGARPVPMPGGLARFTETLAVSPSGRWLAVADHARVVVQDLRTGKLRMSAPVTELQVWRGDRLRFLDERRLRLFGAEWGGPRTLLESRIRAVDFDVETGRILRDVRVPGGGHIVWGLSPGGERILLRSLQMSGGRFEMRVFDLRTGEPPRIVPVAGSFSGAALLRDGRMVFASEQKGRGLLQILDAGAVERKRFPLPGSLVRLGGQPAPGLLFVAAREPGSPRRWRNFLLDVDRGTLKPIAEGLIPAGWPSLPEGSVGTGLFLRGDEGGLVQLDTRTGRQRTIL